MFHPKTLTILKELGEADTPLQYIKGGIPYKMSPRQAKNITFSMGKDASPYPPTINIITFVRQAHKETSFQGRKYHGIDSREHKYSLVFIKLRSIRWFESWKEEINKNFMQVADEWNNNLTIDVKETKRWIVDE